MTAKLSGETEIFQAVVNLPAAERAEFLDGVCGDNPALRREIESLLKAHDPNGSFLRSPALAATRDLAKGNPTLEEQPGSLIGPYKIREKIGEGGFGVVYVAEQEQPVRRKVALKVIKPGMDSREIVARFEAERQALALMDHPHIAKILDASTTASGRPYFVMELVRGVPITDYCNAHKLPTQQRLELFIQVCHAVQHAHQKGVVHRDLKPSNVLVAPHDGVPVVKVIDFGVAKALGQQLTDKSIYTRFASMIGTPLYMSPEQAEINALDVDTRSDVYSLGVLLYELLTGTTPFDRQKLESAAFDEMRRIIREETPESPSARVTTLASAQKDITKTHGLDSGNLAKIIRGDLDVIVMKALEKERGRRYDTASAFAEDVGRFLNQEPILAKPASTVYRLKKFAQRNRGAMLTGSLIAASLLVATFASTWSAIAATRSRNAALASAAEAIAARSQAERSAEDARAAEQAEKLRAEEARLAKLEAEARQAEVTATLNFLTKKFLANSDPGINFLDRRTVALGNKDAAESEITIDFTASSETFSDTASTAYNPTILELLDRASVEISEERIESSFPNQPHVQFTVLHTIAHCYRGTNKPERALPYAERAVKLAEELYGSNDERTIRATLVTSRVYRHLGQFAKSEALARQTLEQSKTHFGADHPITWICMATVANSLYAPAGIHKDKKFIETHRAILERLEAADLAQLPNYEALTDRYPEGWPQFLATGLTVEAKIQAYAGSYGKAIELAERAYSIMTKDGGTETPACIQMRANLGFIKFLSGDTKGACEIQQATLASLVKIYGDEHPTVSPYKIRLARTYLKLRDFRGAIPLLEEVLLREEEFKTIQVGSSTTLGSSGVGVTSICRDLLDAYLATNRLSDAKSLLLSWLAAEDTTDVLLLQDALRVSKGLTKEDAKSLLDSIEQATRRGISSQRLPRIQRVFMADDVRQLALYSDCAMQHLELGDWVNAERLSRECVKQYKSLEEEGRFVSPTQTKPAKYCLGRVLFEQGKYEEAEPLLLAALWTEDELSMASEGMTNMAVTESLERLYQATGR